MLYITTRNDRDAFTVQHVLTQNNGEDGGLYLPLHFPKFTEEELQSLCAVSFNQRVAAILNLFFSSKLTGWDVDFCAGTPPETTPTCLYVSFNSFFIAESLE